MDNGWLAKAAIFCIIIQVVSSMFITALCPSIVTSKYIEQSYQQNGQYDPSSVAAPGQNFFYKMGEFWYGVDTFNLTGTDVPHFLSIIWWIMNFITGAWAITVIIAAVQAGGTWVP